MAYAITQTCCNDASCVSVCPVNCIHPTPDEPDFGTTEMLYIDPRTCIDCGACADACPVDAVLPLDQLAGSNAVYGDLNRQYYEDRPTDNAWDEPRFPRSLPANTDAPRVAIIGTGPAANYTAQAILRSTSAEVTMIDRLPVPGGLVRFGVAPDHPSTKKIGDGFAWLYRHPRLRVHMNVEVGSDLTHAEVAAHHHAVIYAVGAATDKALGISGEDMPGSVSATSFVAWYNAHPDVSTMPIDLSAERAVIVGNGNVALDVARILLADPDELARTDIADHALEALRHSNIREVVLLARRGPEHAAYTRAEFLALQHLPGIQVVVDDHPDVREAVAKSIPGSHAALLSDVAFDNVDWAGAAPNGKRIILRFLASPSEFTGDGRVETIRVSNNAVRERNGESTVESDGTMGCIPSRLVVRSIGYRSSPIPDLPFDAASATVPHTAGRVTDVESGRHLPGTYVVGWIKRGPSGGIGTNRTCADETVDSFIDDAAHHRLPHPPGTGKDFARLVRQRKPDSLGRREMLAIDRAERKQGQKSQRPRVKFATTQDMLNATKRFPALRQAGSQTGRWVR